MWFEVTRWVTLIVLWSCIGVNAWLIVRNFRNLRRWRKEHMERMKLMEEWFDSFRKMYGHGGDLTNDED